MASFNPANVITDPDELSATVRLNAAVVISTIARATNVVTVVTSTAHGLATGEYVTISGVTGGTTSFNGTFGTITVTNSTTFTYAQTGSDESGTTGGSSLAIEARSPGSEVLIDTTNFTILLAVDGNLTVDGVTLKTLYSFLKDRWKADTDLIKFPFPMTPITDEQFEFYNGWNLDKSGSGSSYTPNLIRTGGWAVKDDAGVDIERWVCVITLGTLGDTDQVYFQQIDSVTTDNTTDIVLTGPVNQAIQFYSVDATPAVITSISRSSNTVTVVTSTGHDLVNGQTVIISGVTGGTTSFNGTFTNVTVTNSTTFTYAQTGSNESGTTSISSEAAGIAYDYSQFIQLFVREWQKTYSSATLDDIGVTTLSYQAYRFPLANTADSKVIGLAVSEQAASGDSATITNATWSTGTVTITSNDHGFLAGDVVDISGITPSDYNGTYTIVTASTNSFTYALAADPGSYSSGGTASGDIFNNMNITWYTSGQSQTGFQTPTTAYFSVIIDADVSGTQTPNPSAEQIYAYVQAQLRKTVNINAGSGSTGNKVGKVVPEKLQFIGDDLYTLGISAAYEGVYIADYAEADVNRLHFWGYGSAAVASATITTIARATSTVTVTTGAAHGFTSGDNITISGVTGATTDFNGTFTITVTSSTEFTYSQTGTTESGTTSASSLAAPAEYTNIQFPFTAILTLNFGTNLVADPDAIYKVFFTNDDAATSPQGFDFGTKNAIVVNDKLNSPMSGNVSGATLIQLTYDYDGNIQRGAGSAATNAPITVVAIGLERAQYVIATGTIARSISNSVSLVAPLERNYDPGSV